MPKADPTPRTPLDLRKTRGWTQLDLAAEADVSLDTVRKIEAGEPVGMAVAALVASALGVSLPALVRLMEKAR